MTRLMIVASLLAATSVARAQEGGDKPSDNHGMLPHVKMATSLGDIILELNGEKAPLSTANFLMYAEDKFYDGTIFHRVMSTFMIQGGGFDVEVNQKDGVRPGIKNEWINGLKNVRGTISMARLGGKPDSATCQFFINVVDNANLDSRQRDGAAYAVFGRVIDGMDTVDKIRDTPVSTHPKYGGGRQPVIPVEPVVVKSVTVVGTYDRDGIAAAQTAVADAEKAATEALIKEASEYAAKAAKEAGKEFVATDSGLHYIDLKVGDGATPAKTDSVDVHYTGWLTDGTKFDSSVDRGQPFTVRMAGGVITGWLEGLATMKVGGKRKLIIPPDLGYGERGMGSTIPPNATLVFDVELLAIK